VKFVRAIAHVTQALHLLLSEINQWGEMYSGEAMDQFILIEHF
jgi:hypothetical protein